MMKVVLTFLIVILFSQVLVAQKVVNENMYSKCVEEHVKKYYESTKEILYIERRFGITDYLPDSILNCKLVQVDKKQVKEMARNKAFAIIDVSPIHIENNKITLIISVYSVSYKKKHVFYVKVGYSEFSIDKVDNNYSIVDEYHGGI